MAEFTGLSFQCVGIGQQTQKVGWDSLEASWLSRLESEQGGLRLKEEQETLGQILLQLPHGDSSVTALLEQRETETSRWLKQGWSENRTHSRLEAGLRGIQLLLLVERVGA